MRNWLKATPFALLLVCGCMSSRMGTNTNVEVRLTGGSKSGDTVTISPDGRGTVFNVHSTSGIGRAEISSANGSWRKPLIMRLHLRGLESLSVNNGHVTTQTSVLSRPPYRQLCEATPTGSKRGAAVEATSPFWMTLKIINTKDPRSPVIPLNSGYFEVTLPDVLFESNPNTLFVQWIDFYRM